MDSDITDEYYQIFPCDDLSDEFEFDEDFLSSVLNDDKNKDKSDNSKTENVKKESELNNPVNMNNMINTNVVTPQRKKLTFKFPKNLLFSHAKFRKRKLNLSFQAQRFQNYYYLIFTNKKKFPKEFILQIHKIIQGPLNLKPIVRDIARWKDKYFEEYAKDSDKIIEYLVVNKYTILKQIPNLAKY